MNIKEEIIQKINKNKKFTQSFLWRLIQVLFKNGTSALMFFIATFFLSKEEMGIYNYIAAALALLVIFSDFGISTSASRYVALYKNESKEKSKKVFFNSLLIILIVSVILIPISIVFRKQIFSEYSQYIPYAIPMVILSPLSSLMDGIYRGEKKFKKTSKITILNSITGILSSLLLVYLYGLNGALLAQVIYFGVYSLVMILIYKGYLLKIEKKIIKDVGKYAISFGIATLGFYFFSKVNILILGQYNLLEEIAVYELLNKIYNIFLLPFLVFGQVLAPYIVDMFALGETVHIRKTFFKIFKYLLLAIIIFIPTSILLAKFGIGIIFPEYINQTFNSLLLPVALTFAIAIPTVAINSGILTSTGHAKLMAIQNIISGIVNVILNIFVIKEYGYVGVVWTTFFVQLLSTIGLYAVWLKKFK